MQLITLNGMAYDDAAHAVILPTMAGEITVLGHHEPLMSALKPGVITIRRDANDADSKLQQYATYGGVVEIAHDTVRVLVDEADYGDEINEQEAIAARQEAERLKASAKNQQEMEHAQSMMDRHAVRVRVAEIRRSNRRRS
ncbi:MAG: atpC [Candidatus Saccharibacteria bacterium]|nr:atpC [Candidatus Saccharibacteria bacterium]